MIFEGRMKVVVALVFCLTIVQGLPKTSRKNLTGNEIDRSGKKFEENKSSNLPYDVGVEPKAAACSACASAVNLMKYYIESGRTRDEVMDIFKDICKGTQYRPPEVCDDLIDLIGDELITVIHNATNTPLEICSFFEPTSCGSGDVPGHQWTVELPDVPKPPVRPTPPPNPDTPKLKVLHISDTHFDPQFLIGAVAECSLSMCCRLENGMAKPNETAAGKWGGWKCDIPERTLDNMLEHITKTHPDIDYVVWTGDLPPHNTWSQSKNESIYMLQATVSKVHQYFPNTPVFPALGNHEPSPPHNFPPPILGNQEAISWYYKELVNQWGKFLPETTYETIEAGGYYVAEVRPGFKIISLNTNYCYYNNWWLILNSTDPGNELKWFAEELQKAENNGEIVHVIAHIPPGYYDCLIVWARNFYRILSRYEKTVTAQFYGHTHTDEIEVYYDYDDSTRPIGVAYVAPGVTTHVYMNPGYRVYSVDGDGTDRLVENFETWVMNLTESNLNDNPVWYKMYSAKESYNLTSLVPEEWDNFYERLKTDDQLLDSYDRHYWKDSPKRGECGSGCRRTRLCDIRSCMIYGEPENV